MINGLSLEDGFHDFDAGNVIYVQRFQIVVQNNDFCGFACFKASSHIVQIMLISSIDGKALDRLFQVDDIHGWIVRRPLDQIIADGPDYVISGNQEEMHIVIANRTGKSVRHAFSITNLPTDYICQEFTIRPEQESEESVFPAGAKIHLEEIREHVKARAFPPGKITHIERTPEYHLYTLTYPDAITYISFMGC